MLLLLYFLSWFWCGPGAVFSPFSFSIIRPPWMNDWEKNKSDGFFFQNNNTFNFAILKNAERTWAPAVKTSTLALSDVLIQRKKTHIMNWYYTMPNVVTLCRMSPYTPDVHGIIFNHYKEYICQWNSHDLVNTTVLPIHPYLYYYCCCRFLYSIQYIVYS